MAGSGVTLYSTTSAGNKTVIGTIDWREDVYMPSQINDNLGQIMADIRALANSIGTGWIEIGDGDGVYTATYVAYNQFRFEGLDVTAYYRAGMRVRVQASTPGTLSGTIITSTFATHTTITVVWDVGGLSNEAITWVQVGIGSGSGGGAGVQYGYRNILARNGGMEVWQRGAGGAASFVVAASAGAYTADGWYVYSTGSKTVVQGGGITNGSRYSAHVTRTAGESNTGPVYFEFPLDSDELMAMRGSLVTLSMTLQAGANFSATGGLVSVLLATGTSAPARIGTYTGQVNSVNATQAITTTATRYAFTSTAVPTNIQQATVIVYFTPVGTAGADDGIYIDDVHLQIGSGALFDRVPFADELALCQRHYEKVFRYARQPAQASGDADSLVTQNSSGGGVTTGWRFATRKRITPTVTTFNPTQANANFRNLNNTADFVASVFGIGETGCAITSGVVAPIGDIGTIFAVADAGI